MVSRRSFLLTGLAAGACVRGAPATLAGDSSYSAAATDLVRRSTVIDMLGLLTLDYYGKLRRWEENGKLFQAADFERLKASGITVFHPAVGFVDGDVYALSLADLAGWNQFLAGHPEWFLRVDRAADISRAKGSGRIGIILGLQNSAHFRTVDDVDRFYAMGQRVSQLTYHDNRIGGGSTDPKNPGLTPYGAEIIGRMNRLGMTVDISHCSDRTALDAIDASAAPVLATHSNCRALVPGKARCRTDEAIRKLAARGGVFGVTMIRSFAGGPGPVTIENVLDHIDHVAEIAGVEHVGVGTDTDLTGRDRAGAPKASDLDGLDYSRKIYALTEGLLRRGYAEAEIQSILGGNFERALAQIWRG